MSDETVIVAPHTGGDDAPAALAAHNPAHAPTMDALVAPSRYARPYLSLAPRDVIVAAVEALDARLAEPATMAEYPPVVAGGKRLFRYVQADGEELIAMGVLEVLVDEHIRALWWELAEAVEAKARRR